MTELLIYILATSFAIMLASVSGVLFAWKTVGDWLRKRLSYAIALAAGIFLVTIFNLVHEVVVEGFSFTFMLSFLLGGLLLEGVTYLLPKESHHHHHGDCEHGVFNKIDARRVLIGDAIHNIHDGLTLVPAFIISPSIGLGTAFGILLHEIVQEIAEFFILKQSGYSTKKALLWNFLASATILIGVLLALFVASVSTFATYLVAFSAGGFLYVLIRDLLPTVLAHAHKERAYKTYVTLIGMGIVLMLLVSQTSSHSKHNHLEEEFLIPDGFGLAQSSTETLRT